MGWTFDANATGSTNPRTLVAGVAVLAAVVFLLWFGSLRIPDTVSAEGSRSTVECPLTQQKECGEVVSSSRSEVRPAAEGTSHAYVRQEPVGRGFFGITAFENAGNAVTGEISQRCLLPGNPCFSETDYAVGELQAAGHGFQGNLATQ